MIPSETENQMVALGQDVSESADIADSERRETVQNVVRRAVEEAVMHYQENLEPDQKKATDYYYGREFGNERERRSTIVSTDVRDITLSQIPSLARIIWSADNVVEFRARRPEKEAEALQATEVVRYIITEDNPGFLSTVSVLKDGLVRRLGWWKWWWGDDERTETLVFHGLNQQAVYVLVNDESINDVEVLGQYEMQTPTVPGEQPAPPVPLYDIRITRRDKRGRVYVAEVPPEEVSFTPNARSLDEAPCVIHSRYVPADYLLSRGFDPELVEKAAGLRESMDGAGMAASRQVTGVTEDRSQDALDESQQPVLFTEAYVLISVPGKPGYESGRAERRRFDCIGPTYEIANEDGLGECVDEVPLAFFTPEPEPHTIVGLSNYDLVGSDQLVKSQVERHTLDSLAEAVNPVTIVLTGAVNMGDLLKPDASRIVRVKGDVNNVMREVKSTFVGPDTLPMLAYFDQKIERNTGVENGSSGLDADALQSTDKQGVASVLSAKQQRTEMIARVYSETTMKRLYKGVLKLFCRYQNQSRFMRMRGKWVEIDPRTWDITMDVTVNVALGQGTPQDRLQALAAVVSNTKELLASGSPLVSNVELRRSIARGYQGAGLNPDDFIRPWGPEEEAAYQQSLAAAPPPPPTPEQQLVDVENKKNMAVAAVAAEKMDLERYRLELEDDRERDRMAQEYALALEELKLKYHAENLDAAVKTAIADSKNAQAPNP